MMQVVLRKCSEFWASKIIKCARYLLLTFDRRHCLQKLGLSDVERKGLMTVVAIVLHIGNIKFEETMDKDLRISTTSTLEHISDLIGTNVSRVSDALRYRVIAARGEEMKVPLQLEKAYDSRNSMAMSLYVRVFDWVVRRVNKATGQTMSSDLGNMQCVLS